MNAWQKLAENRIQEAIESGDLVAPDTGTPLDLSDYFALPPGDRVGISLLKGAGVIPPEVESLKRAVQLEMELAGAEPAKARGLSLEIQAAQVSFRMAMERRARTARDA